MTPKTSDRLIAQPTSAEDEYAAGKWGRYLRAPDLYFDVVERFGQRLIPLGSLVTVRFGVKTGCDDFFMPFDVSKEVLDAHPDDRSFRREIGIPRLQVVSGTVSIVRDGAGTLHPVETKYLRPEVHTLRDHRRPIVRARNLDRVILLVSDRLAALRGTHVYRYLKYGEQTSYESRKSKHVPVPERSTCAARDPWYDLTGLVQPGFALWPMAHQYRHVIPGNPDGVVCNHRMFDLINRELTKQQCAVLVAILNSTWIGFTKTFFGRYTGTEGALDTEIIDVDLLEVPDPRAATPDVTKKILAAFRSIAGRDIGRYVADDLMECRDYERAKELVAGSAPLPAELQAEDRRELDEAVFELLGVSAAKERRQLVDALYREITTHFRNVRLTEIQKVEDRRKGESKRYSANDLAADAWDALDLLDLTPLAEWLAAQVKGDASAEAEVLTIPSDRPVELPDGNALFEKETVYFGPKRRHHVVCHSRGQAELLSLIATWGVTGDATLPKEEKAARDLAHSASQRHEAAAVRLRELAASRSGDEEVQEEVYRVLERWFVVGRSVGSGSHPVTEDEIQAAEA